MEGSPEDTGLVPGRPEECLRGEKLIALAVENKGIDGESGFLMSTVSLMLSWCKIDGPSALACST